MAHALDLRPKLRFAVASTNPKLHTLVAGAASAAAGRFLAATDGAQLVAALGDAAPCVVVVDRNMVGDLQGRIGTVPGRERLVVIVVCRERATLPPGIDLAVLEPALHEALALVSRAEPGASPPIALDRLLAASLLHGPIDRAISDAADQLAASFGVDQAVIALRDDAAGSAVSCSRTMLGFTWDLTVERCRAAVDAGTTLLAPAADDAERCESYLAVPITSSFGRGFVGVVARRSRLFGRDHRDALEGVAARFASELAWRTLHHRSTDELARALEAPGFDPLLAIWNRAAVSQLIGMHASAGRRARMPLPVAVIDVVDLHGINTRYGTKTGDRVLLRIADALRTTLRQEDVIGRWSGDAFVIALPDTPADSVGRVAERVHAALAARSLELPGGDVIAIRATIGVTTIGDKEDPEAALHRAEDAAEQAQGDELSIVHVDTSRRRFVTGRTRHAPEVAHEDNGTIIGGEYRLLHEISHGGMGVVYRAEDLALERPVAIKMLRHDLGADPGLLEQLRGEAATLARIQHPNLVQVYSFGHRAGGAYLVMELVEGESLEQAFDRHLAEHTAMSIDELVAVVEQVSSALDALHDRGIVHRDVKPANVIRDPFRARSVLVDVGIASRHGQSQETAGTPGFMAPEVITGKGAGPRSDVYGLAATAYAMLTQTLPWGTGSIMQVLSKQLECELVPPSNVRPELALFDDVLAGAMHAEPERRPRSAGEFARGFAEAAAPLLEARPRAPSPAAPTPGAAADTGRRTRGVVFRSVTRAIGVREAARLRDALGNDAPELARLLADAAPLAWLPTEMFARLLAVAEPHVARDQGRLARDIARATVRASFRRFFPTSAATLVPDRTLSAIRNVWSRYHSWGQISSMPVTATEVVVRLVDTMRDPRMCEWTCGMLDQVLVLSGASAPSIEHEACEARGDAACLFRVTWGRTG
ncbi:MAG TPA: DUF2378 family protein [Kofleriaceae bacterium]|nr:DUF2378 family protein [Kofleriaceae bacterium]